MTIANQKLALLAASFSLVALMHSGQMVFAETAEEYFQSGQTAYSNGQQEEALNFYQQATQANPALLDAYFNQGAILYNLKRYTEAQRAFEALLSQTPDDHAARYELARVYEKLGKTNEALKAYNMIPPSALRYGRAQENIARLLTASPEPLKAATVPSNTASSKVAPTVSPQALPVATNTKAVPSKPVIATSKPPSKPAPASSKPIARTIAKPVAKPTAAPVVKPANTATATTKSVAKPIEKKPQQTVSFLQEEAPMIDPTMASLRPSTVVPEVTTSTLPATSNAVAASTEQLQPKPTESTATPVVTAPVKPLPEIAPQPAEIKESKPVTITERIPAQKPVDKQSLRTEAETALSNNEADAALERLRQLASEAPAATQTTPIAEKSVDKIPAATSVTNNPTTEKPVEKVVVQPSQPEPKSSKKAEEKEMFSFLSPNTAAVLSQEPQQSVMTQLAKVQEYVSGLAGPTGMALDRSGTLYVANFSRNTIFKVTPSGQKILFASGTGINGPVGMVIDSKTGDLYVANHLDNSVSKISPAGKVTVLATGLKKPYNLYLDEPHQLLYVSQQETNSVARIRLN